METILLAIQARVLLWVGLAYLGLGLWLGTSPMALAWRAPLAALAAMIVMGWLLRQVAAVIEERAAADIAERELAAEQAAIKSPPLGMQAHRVGQQHQRPARA